MRDLICVMMAAAFSIASLYLLLVERGDLGYCVMLGGISYGFAYVSSVWDDMTAHARWVGRVSLSICRHIGWPSLHLDIRPWLFGVRLIVNQRHNCYGDSVTWFSLTAGVGAESPSPTTKIELFSSASDFGRLYTLELCLKFGWLQRTFQLWRAI